MTSDIPRFGFAEYTDISANEKPKEICRLCGEPVNDFSCGCKNKIWFKDTGSKYKLHSYVYLEDGEIIDLMKSMILKHKDVFEMIVAEIKSEIKVFDYPSIKVFNFYHKLDECKEPEIPEDWTIVGSGFDEAIRMVKGMIRKEFPEAFKED